MIVETTQKVDDSVLKHFADEEHKGYLPCAMSFINKNGEVMEHVKNMGCHYRLMKLDKAKYAKALYFSLWYDQEDMYTDKDCNDYFDFILDKEKSPWRPLLKHSRIIKDGNKYKAIYITNIEDMPHQYLSNFAVATRQPTEHADEVISTWIHLRDKYNLSPLQAMYIISHFVNGGGYEGFYVGSGGHFQFDPQAPNSFARLRDANPNVNPRLTFKSDNGYTPMNAIWYDSKDAYFFNKLAEGTPYTGVFTMYHQYASRVINGMWLTKKFQIPSGKWVEEEIKKGDCFK